MNMAENTHVGLDPAVKYRLYRFSVWCGMVVLLASTVAFFFLGKLFPPPDPNWGATEISAFFTENRTRIIWSVIMMGFFAPFFYFFAAITSIQIKRIEGELGLLSLVQLTTGVIAPTGWIYPMSVLATATFRPERNPELLLLINDQFFLTLVGVAFIFSLNLVSIGIAALADRREKPVFPRWLGYANLFMALLFAPGIFVYAFTDGPLAWNGLFALWIPASAFPVWKIMMIVCLLKAVRSEEEEERAGLRAA
jgi:hypothetical protein